MDDHVALQDEENGLIETSSSPQGGEELGILGLLSSDLPEL